jgi:hypothetical protein
LTLFAAIGVAFGADRGEVSQWLLESGLRDELTESETDFINTPDPSPKQAINATWLSERLVVLLWALQEVDFLPRADEQCDTAVFQDVLPPFTGMTTDDFIGEALLRPDAELLAMSEKILELHGEARDAKLKGRSPRVAVDLEIIQERHFAINWVVGYEALPWDEVTADT